MLLSLLVLFVIILIMWQLNVATVTGNRVAKNNLSLRAMDLAIESALLEVTETLLADAEAGGEESGAGDPFGAGGADPTAGLGGEEGGEDAGGPVDSRRDDWATPIRTEINGIRLRILVQDEDSKLNVLQMLSEDEDEARKAFERVVNVLDWCRHGTDADIEGGDAREMAEAMREHLVNRTNSFLPRPTLLTDLEEKRDQGLPLSMREFIVLEGFEPDHFRDYLDEDEEVVHSITSFLTVWTALTTRDQFEQDNAEAGTGGAGAGGGATSSGTITATSDGVLTGGDGGSNDDGGPDGDATASTGGPETGDGPVGGQSGPGFGTDGMGIGVNINTAPIAVLRSLMDDRDVSPRLWEAVLEYRNEEDEEAMGEDEDEEPPVDEFGEEIIVPKIFEDLSTLEEFDDYRDLDAAIKAELDALLTVESNVFSIIVTARKPTGVGAGMDFTGSQEELEEEERSGQSLTRTVRCVVWRRETDDGYELIPLERWEVCDYMPWEVEDFPEEDR